VSLVVASPSTVDLIMRRAEVARVAVPVEVVGQLGDYVGLLAKWNRTINLTALAVEPPTEAAIDRLIIEPLIASRYVRLEDRRCLDVGSGGGSPALPLALMCPALRMILVESRSRKAAFLREAIRQLGLGAVTVENCRLEALARPELCGTMELITLRAVRLDEQVASELARLLAPGGRVFFFGACDLGDLGGLRVFETVDLVRGRTMMILNRS
jgi:16S rRNA (guanine527-N7)-methyltransferase